MSKFTFHSSNPCKNASNKLVDPENGGAIATNFLIFLRIFLFSCFNKLVKAIRVPYE
jgi:hypothetical protein